MINTLLFSFILSECTEVGQLEELLTIEIDAQEMRHVCEARDLTGSENKPNINFFKITDDVKHKLRELYKIKDGIMFQRIWKLQSNRTSETNHNISINDIFIDVYDPTCELMKVMLEKLKDGSILLCEVDEYFGNDLTIDQLLYEIRSMEFIDSTEDWVSERMSQIEKYRKMRSDLKGAKGILKLKETYDLEGDFSGLDQLIETVRLSLFMSIIID